jgi:Tripartite ATP-independent periplasmic transporter, DctM component
MTRKRGQILTSTVFAMATGIVGAAVTVLGIMASPIMIKSGYDGKLSSGTITAGGTLGILIPPSVMLVPSVWGSTRNSFTKVPSWRNTWMRSLTRSRPAGLLSWWQSGWNCCVSWCPERRVWRCWSIRRTLRLPRPRAEPELRISDAQLKRE